MKPLSSRIAITIFSLVTSLIATNAQKVRLFLPQQQLIFLHDSLSTGSVYPLTVSWQGFDSILTSMMSTHNDQSFLQRHLIKTDNDNFGVIINPVLTNVFSNSFDESNTITDSEFGIHTIIKAGQKISLQGSYSFNYTNFSSFVTSKIDTLEYIPHHGKYKQQNNMYRWNNLKANITYAPFDFLNLQAGIGKNFYGNGYRSLFISGNSNHYPYVSANVDVWKIQYSYLLGFLNDVHEYSIPVKIKSKYAAFHYLNWNITDFISLNLFETIVWAADDSTIHRGFDLNYLNPVIFFRPVEFATGSPDNVLLGAGLNVRFFGKNYLYGQFLLDEFNLSLVKEGNGWWGVKFGYQAGLKFYTLFQIPSLFTQLEFNTARPFTYSHAFSAKSYGNYLQPLAHPLGSNFIEILNHTTYKQNRLKFQNRLFLQRYGRDDYALNYGNDIYVSNDNRARDYNNEILQPEAITLLINDFSIAYTINPFWQMDAIAGIFFRSEIEPTSESFSQIYFGIKTNLSRRDYWDGRY